MTTAQAVAIGVLMMLPAIIWANSRLRRRISNLEDIIAEDARARLDYERGTLMRAWLRARNAEDRRRWRGR
jgi:hypothetical protein